MKKIPFLILFIIVSLVYFALHQSSPLTQKEPVPELAECTPHDDVLLKVNDTVFSIPRKNFLWAENERRESLIAKARCGRSEDRPLVVSLFGFMIGDTFPVKYNSVIDGHSQDKPPALAMRVTIHSYYRGKTSYQNVVEEMRRKGADLDKLPIIDGFYVFNGKSAKRFISRDAKNMDGEPIVLGCDHKVSDCGVSIDFDGIHASTGFDTEFIPPSRFVEYYKAFETYIQSLKCVDCK